MAYPYGNEAELYIHKKDNKASLIVEFGLRNIELQLNSDEEVELVETLLGDVNFWASFVNSLSAAITQHK